tara:strand:+ start:400385 stop:402541 length:2157 start_codon:yes stop_codon:yes gene_type:complete
MPAAMSDSTNRTQRAKSAIERLGTALLSGHPESSRIDVFRLNFELRVILQRIFILDRVEMLDEIMTHDDPLGSVLGMDLESQLFPVEQLDHDRIWSADWVALVRREFGLAGGKWLGELVEECRGLAPEMGAVDESLMGWTPRIEGGEFKLSSEDGSDRQSGGVFYTPASLVGYVLDRALTPMLDECGDDVDRLLRLRVCDPACGCGYFLIESAKRIADRVTELGGGDRRGEVVRSSVFGGDVNPLTAEICRWMVWFAVGDRSVSIESLRSNIVHADALLERDRFAGGFDVVVGNPPFLNQLGSGTARSRDRVKLLREQGLVGAATYTDEASAFFVLGLQMARDGGRVCMVQPQSVVATRGGAHARERAAEMGWLESLWVSNEHVFGDASVYTCAPCVVVGGAGDRIERYSSGVFVAYPAMSLDGVGLASLDTWSSIAAVTMGVPEILVRSSGVVGDVATATADFRDEYYGLEGNIVEDGDDDGGIALLTTGLVDLGRCMWGTKATRILKRRWESPRVNRRLMEDDARLARWVGARGVEKVLVATQTKVVEALVDSDGAGGGKYAAVTPMISVMVTRPDCAEDGESGHPDGVDVWKLGAAIGSPVCSVHAMRHFGGAAMHADALKMSAKQVLKLPLPSDFECWNRGAAAFERLHGVCNTQEKTPSVRCAATSPGGPGEEMENAYSEAVIAFGVLMCEAYGVVGEEQGALMKWWLGRLGI